MNARYVLDKLAIQRNLELFAEAALLPSEDKACPSCGAHNRVNEGAPDQRCLICDGDLFPEDAE